MMRVPSAGKERGTARDDGCEEACQALRCRATGLSGGGSEGASLDGVAQTLPNLHEANLAGAALMRADLRWVGLCAANLRGDIQHEADLGGVDLENTTMPDGKRKGPLTNPKGFTGRSTGG